MRKVYHDQQTYSQRLYLATPRKRYSFFSFVFDLVMVAFTGGLWLIWIFVREMRAR